MKLLYITNGINGSGGLERVLSVKASLLAEDFGYEVAILCLNNAHENPFYPFSEKIQTASVSVGGNPISYFSAYKKGIQQFVNTYQPDVIFVCDDGLKGFFLPKIIQTKAKWVYERHVSKLIESNTNQNFIQKTITHFKWYLMERLGKNFSKFIVLTEGNKKEWSSLKNIEVISNPLPFQSDEKSSQKNKVVICVGKISYQKGQDLLLKIWENVHQDFPDWQLHLYGKENLNFLDTQHLKNNVYFFPPEKNIQQKYLDSSIYVMPSRFEGFGMVLIEAMEFGLPCVSFDCDYGPGDIIHHGEDGFLIENGNTKDFTEKLKLLISNHELRIKMGEAAKVNVEKYYPKHIMHQWDDLLNQLSIRN